LYEQLTWTSTISSKLLLQAGVQAYHFDQRFLPQRDITPNIFSFTEVSTGVNTGPVRPALDTTTTRITRMPPCRT
jgi:hypothetical protein